MVHQREPRGRQEVARKLLALAPIAALVLLCAVARVASLRDQNGASWIIGVVLWASLAGVLATLLIDGLLPSRPWALRVPSVAGIAVSVGNLSLGSAAVFLSYYSGYGVVPSEVAMTASLTFVTAGLLFCGAVLLSAEPTGSQSGRLESWARGLGLANGIAAIGSAIIIALAILNPPVR